MSKLLAIGPVIIALLRIALCIYGVYLDILSMMSKMEWLAGQKLMQPIATFFPAATVIEQLGPCMRHLLN